MVSEESRVSGFAILDAIARNTPDLLNNERSVFSAIAAYSDGQATCFPSQTRLAKNMGKTREWVSRMVQRLVAKEYVTCRRSNGGRRSLTYEINTEKLGLAPVAPAAQSQPVETADPAEAAESIVAPKEPTRAKGFYPAPRPAPGGSAEYAEVLRRLSGMEQAIALLTQMVAAQSEHRYSTRMRGMGGDLIQTEFVFHEVSEADFLNPPIPAEWSDIPEGVKPAWSAEDCEAFTMDIPCPFPLVPAPGGSKPGTAEQLSLGLGDSTPKPAAKPVDSPVPPLRPAWNIEDGWKRFWDAYPRHNKEKEAHKNFVTMFRRLTDPEARLQRLLGIIKQMKRTEKWNENDGQFITYAKNFVGRDQVWKECEEDLANGKLKMLEDDEDEDVGYDPSRPECLQRSPASDAELVTRMVTGRPANAPAAPKPAQQWTKVHWRLCSERCKNYDPEKVCCRCGVKVPPEWDRSHVRPPEECKHFERIEGEEPTPRTLDELMNESLRPALRTGVRGVKPLASVFGGVLSSMGVQA